MQWQSDEFRSSRPHRTRLPETLWQSAVELAMQYGLHPVAHPLRLDYTQLKKRLEGVDGPQEKAAPQAFVELIAAHPVTAERRRPQMDVCFCTIAGALAEKRNVQSGGGNSINRGALQAPGRVSVSS